MNGKRHIVKIRNLLGKVVLAICLLVILEPKARAGGTDHSAVLELFTSQGCSSCPAADSLLKDLAHKDPSLIALSFHVHYWDNLGWKDPYSSPLFTERQRGYAKAMDSRQIFTPQLIVDGYASVVGSDEGAVRSVIAKAESRPAAAKITFLPRATSQTLSILLEPLSQSPAQNVSVWEVRFDRSAKTQVRAGENSGRMLENVNNVTSVTRLGSWTAAPTHYDVSWNGSDQGIAVFVQEDGMGKIVAAAQLLNAN